MSSIGSTAIDQGELPCLLLIPFGESAFGDIGDPRLCRASHALFSEPAREDLEDHQTDSQQTLSALCHAAAASHLSLLAPAVATQATVLTCELGFSPPSSLAQLPTPLHMYSLSCYSPQVQAACVPGARYPHRSIADIE